MLSLDLIEDHHLLDEVLLIVLDIARGHIQHVNEVLLHHEVEVLRVVFQKIGLESLCLAFRVVPLFLRRLRK